MILIGDSDGPWTRQRLLVAGSRFAAQERVVLIDMAPAGADWNDILQSDEVAA